MRSTSRYSSAVWQSSSSSVTRQAPAACSSRDLRQVDADGVEVGAGEQSLRAAAFSAWAIEARTS
jgi:hypothetical protein